MAAATAGLTPVEVRDHMPVASTFEVSEVSAFAHGRVSAAQEYLLGWLTPSRRLAQPGLALVQDFLASVASTQTARDGDCRVAPGDAVHVLQHAGGGTLTSAVLRCGAVGMAGQPGLLLALHRLHLGRAAHATEPGAAAVSPGVHVVGEVNPLLLVPQPPPNITLVVPYHDRPDTLTTFLAMLQRAVLTRPPRSDSLPHPLHVRLVLAVMDADMTTVRARLDAAALPLAADDVTLVSIEQTAPGALPPDRSFTRAAALHAGASVCSANTLMFFLDVDMGLTRATLARAALHAHPGVSAAFPVVWSQYKGFTSTSVAYNEGYWRIAGFGNMALYKADYDRISNFAASGQRAGWGREDSLFTSAALATPGFHVARYLEPSLLHRWHPKSCAGIADPDTRQSCENVAVMNSGSHLALAARVAELEAAQAAGGA